MRGVCRFWGRYFCENSLQSVDTDTNVYMFVFVIVRVQEPCEGRGGRPGLFVLLSLMVSVDVKQH